MPENMEQETDMAVTPIEQADPFESMVAELEERAEREVGEVDVVMVIKAPTNPQDTNNDGFPEEQARKEDAPAANAEPAKAPLDLWTLDDMERGRPVPCLYERDPQRQFTARPVLYRPYCQKRLALMDEYAKDKGKGKVKYTQVHEALAQVVWHCMKGCTWTARRILWDEQGDPLLDDEGQIVTEPVPLTRDSIDELDLDQLLGFVNGIARVMQGEASGQP